MRVHGGNPPPGTIDFSSPQNPLPPPQWLGEEAAVCIARGVHSRYYDPSLAELKELLAGLDRLEPDRVHVANGSAEILAWLPAVLKPGSMVVVEPNFGDHEIQAMALGVRLHRIPMIIQRDKITLNMDSMPEGLERPLILVSRPNNPTGMALARGEIEWLEEVATRRRGWVVVDEAFQPLSDLDPYEPGERAIIVRTLTKSLSAPGLRLGYAHSPDRRVIERLESARQPWPIDSVTLCTYMRILSSRIGDVVEYIRRGRRAALVWGRDLASMLEKAGLTVYRSRAPFILVRHSIRHPEAGRKLNMHGVHVRDASSFYGLDATYSRVSVRSPRENRILVEAFKALLGG